ncbi:hypothetical protein [Halospeciosus flavus]|uniref:DUF7969 domain-containing protein n=1 Tax=Halospeciosus flavus TaxID=3032283 RepID=A0ABD5Z1L0_9EURY|nr:hypothetical protein [Halospeciosus flavus]
MTTVEVTYHCPHCETVVALERDAYLADKSVTPYPLEGWTYVAPTADYEREDATGVRFVCGESDGCRWRPSTDAGDAADAPEADDATVGCGEPFYLSFVRFEDGEPVERERESEYVQLAEGTVPTGPRGPPGPSGP